MLPLSDKRVIVIGVGRGIGRQVVNAAVHNGAHVLAVARREGPLRQLARDTGVEILTLDATGEDAASRVFGAALPDVLVLCGGAFPPAAPLHELTWPEFAINWEADVKIAFEFCKTALLHPMPAGSSVVLIASGAAMAGSPISGGYAGAKRTPMFIANYSQKESDRLGLGLRFSVLAPRIVPDTQLGEHAVAGYARYLGISPVDFIRSMESPPSALDVANAVIELATHGEHFKGKVCVVSGKGLQAA